MWLPFPPPPSPTAHNIIVELPVFCAYMDRRQCNIEQRRLAQVTSGEVMSCHVTSLVPDGVYEITWPSTLRSGDALRPLYGEQMSLEWVKKAEQRRWHVWACFLKGEGERLREVSVIDMNNSIRTCKEIISLKNMQLTWLVPLCIFK